MKTPRPESGHPDLRSISSVRRGPRAARRRNALIQKADDGERLKLARAVAQVAEGIVILDPEGRVEYANPAFEAQYGLKVSEAEGRSYLDLLERDAAEEGTARAFREALKTGGSLTYRLSDMRPDGRSSDLEVTLSPVRDVAGRLTNFVAVHRDVTREVKFQERIRQWQKMEALGTLAGGIAHDFNNILLPILINTELALLEEKADSHGARRLAQVLDAAKRGRDMVKQIIAFSRQREQERRPVEIYPVIKEALKFLQFSIPKNIRIVEKIETDTAVVLADPTQIHQILMNLCSNSAHAMRARGGVLEIGLSEVRVDPVAAARFIDLRPGAYVKLSVSDTGHGMTPEVMERAFDPFYTTKKQGEGTGMGLSVVHGIVKSYGGAITCSSEPGKGTVFEVLLPQISERRVEASDSKDALPGGSERILFVDDEDIQIRAMNKLLTHLGYQVIGVTDARSALEIFRRQPEAFDLLITDQTMPSMAGERLAREVLQIRPGLPVILCTGFSDMIDESTALAMGITAFMMKPFTVRDIAETIRRVLSPAD